MLIAVNIGGLGTPVASLASLITLGEYRSANGGGARRYLGLFSAINFFVSCNPDGGFAVDFAAAVNALHRRAASKSQEKCDCESCFNMRSETKVSSGETIVYLFTHLKIKLTSIGNCDIVA